MRSSLLVTTISLLFLFSAPTLRGETIGRLKGAVVDQNGAGIGGALVNATRVGTNIRSQATTSDEGEFAIELPRGEYVLTISANGFDGSSRTVYLRDDAMRIDAIVLAVQNATASVTVSDEAMYVANEISSATKTYTPLRDVPQSVTVIKRDQIRDQLLTSMASIVQYVPGISSHQGENNRDDIIFRGNRSNADFFRDGVRDDVQYYRDPYNLERLEALKGPNAMIFGRGGGGGVINRVTKEARFLPVREFTATGGSFYNRRFTGDLGQSLTDKIAFRLNGVYEKSDSFRRFVNLNRVGLNPTITFAPDGKTSINLAYEFFRDRRVADRGVTSFQNLPVDLPISTFYGDPANSSVRANINVFTGTIERLFGDVIFRNRALYANYDRGYQNYVPGAVNATKTLVTLTAYNNATRRRNFFDQTDLTYSLKTGRVKHTFIGGAEFGRQITDNLRKTGFFNNTSTSIQVPFDDPLTNVPITFRQSATDADNHLRLNLAAAFVQDQVELSRFVQLIAGVRFDYFDLKYDNNRNGDTLRRIDRLTSPRFGIVIKPMTVLSLYGSYSVSFLPSSGDQFSSLTNVTQQVKPEKFQNIEGGIKWDIRPGLLLTTALYRLDRTNTRSSHPNNPTLIIQTGRQRTNGLEIGLSGNITSKWSMSGGYSYQNARILSATTAAPAGRQVGQVPHDMFSLWNKYHLTRKLSAGLGLIARSNMFAAIDNTVVLRGFFKADAAVYYNFNEHWRLQANIENVTNKRYFINADNNTNISPGSPRAVKVGLTARF